MRHRTRLIFLDRKIETGDGFFVIIGEGPV